MSEHGYDESKGTGIALDENLDFSVVSGGLASTKGMQELQKDLTLQIIIAVSEYLGATPTQNNKVSVLSDVTTVCEADDRVERVDQEETTVEFVDRRKRIVLDMTVLTNDDELNFVVDVE